MEISGIEEFGSPILSGIDISGGRAGQRLVTKGGQYVRFYNKTVTEFKASKVNVKVSAATGAQTETPSEFVPVPVTKEWVHIVTPGDKNEIDTIAELDHKREFPIQYRAFREGRTAPIGMPLDKAPFIPAHIVTELNINKVFTVEQLAELPEYMCGTIPEGYQLREYARAAVKANQSNEVSAQVLTLQHELKQRDIREQELRSNMEELKAMIYGKPVPPAPQTEVSVQVERTVETTPENKTVAKKGKPKGETKTIEKVITT